MNIGVRAHDFGRMTIEELAEKAAEKGFKCIQLALDKSLSGYEAEPGFLSPGAATHVRDVLYKKGVNISVLGCYINPIHPDLEVRRKSIERFKEYIRFARDFGCSIIATETGSLNADCSYHPDTDKEETFDIFRGIIEELVREAEKFGVIVGVEPVADKHTISTPQKMKKLLDVIESNNLQVIFDPVNIIPEKECEKQNEIITQSFDLFKEQIIAVHVKDFVIENGLKNGNLPAGEGMLNYGLLFKLLKKHKPNIAILAENNSPETFDSCIKFLKDIYNKS